MIIVDVFVPGAAKTKGSMEIRNRATGAMKESVVGSSRWRALMAQAVRDDIAARADRPLKHLPRCHCYSSAPHLPHAWSDGDEPVACWGEPAVEHHYPALPYPGAVAVTVEAYLTPPAGFFDRLLYVLAPTWNQAGDLDKIVRNVLDALGSTSKNPKMNGGAIVDDNLVCRIEASKFVAGAEDFQQPAGVRIVVETL